MYAVAVTILFQDGKLEELNDFFENSGFPALETLKGDMYSIAFFNPKDNVNLGIAFMKDKETAEKFKIVAQYGRDVLTAVIPRIEKMTEEYLQIEQHVFPWGNQTRLFVMGKVVTHSSKHLGYAAAAIGSLGREAPSF